MSKLSFARSALGFVEAAQGVIVVKQFQECVHITPFGLKLLRHRRENDFALVNRRKIESAFAGAKHLGNFGGQEVLQVVADGFTDAAKLLGGLGEKTVEKVRVNGGPAWRFEKIFKIFHFFFEQIRDWTTIHTRRATSRGGSIQRAFQVRARCGSAPGF